MCIIDSPGLTPISSAPEFSIVPVSSLERFHDRYMSACAVPIFSSVTDMFSFEGCALLIVISRTSNRLSRMPRCFSAM